MTELKLVKNLPESDVIATNQEHTSLSDHTLPTSAETPVHDFYDFKSKTTELNSERVKLRAVVGDTAPSDAPVAGTTQQEVLEFAKTFHQPPEANGMVGGVNGLGGGSQWQRYPVPGSTPSADSARFEEVRASNITERERTEELARIARVQSIRDDRIHDLFNSAGLNDLPREMHARLFNKCRGAVDHFMYANPGIIPVVVYFPQTHRFLALEPKEASSIKIGGVSSGGLSSSTGGQRQGGGSQGQEHQGREEEADREESTIGQKLKTAGRALFRLVQSDPPPADHPNYLAQTKETHLLCGMVNRLAGIADEIRDGWGQVNDFTGEIEDLRTDIKTLANHLYSKSKLSAEGVDAARHISTLAEGLYSNPYATRQAIIEAMEPLLREQRR